jgi:hypothetical protein
VPDRRQVFSPGQVSYGQAWMMNWLNWMGPNTAVVPPGLTLEVTSITCNFFPSGGATVGRANIAGRDAPGLGTGNAVWYFQAIYVEPLKTVHLTFPDGLLLEEDGHVEIGFYDNGPGDIFVELHGALVLA